MFDGQISCFGVHLTVGEQQFVAESAQESHPLAAQKYL